MYFVLQDAVRTRCAQVHRGDCALARTRAPAAPGLRWLGPFSTYADACDAGATIAREGRLGVRLTLPCCNAAKGASAPRPAAAPSRTATTPVRSHAFSIKRAFLIALIASLSLSALVAILVFVGGDIGEIEFRVLMTTLAVGGFSLVGMSASVWVERRRLLPLAFATFAASGAAFLWTLGFVWEAIEFEWAWKVFASLLILAVALGHASLVMLSQGATPASDFVVYATLVMIGIVASLLLLVVLSEGELTDADGFWRLLAIMVVLDVLGTVVAPIVKKAATMRPARA